MNFLTLLNAKASRLEWVPVSLPLPPHSNNKPDCRSRRLLAGRQWMRWRESNLGYKMKNVEEQKREPMLGETTLEDFLVKAGLHVADAALESVMSLDSALNSQDFSPQIGLSPSPSLDALSDTPLTSRKRDSGDVEKAVERRLRRKIKNRESAARSRARKQAYHNELVSKVSHLEEENAKLKQEQEFEEMVSCDLSELRYQLRRTSSV